MDYELSQLSTIATSAIFCLFLFFVALIVDALSGFEMISTKVRILFVSGFLMSILTVYSMHRPAPEASVLELTSLIESKNYAKNQKEWLATRLAGYVEGDLTYDDLRYALAKMESIDEQNNKQRAIRKLKLENPLYQSLMGKPPKNQNKPKSAATSVKVKTAIPLKEQNPPLVNPALEHKSVLMRSLAD